MRIELKKRFNRREVFEWMNSQFGYIEEGKTWFWSAGDVYLQESEHYPGLIEEKMKPEGVEVWVNDTRKIMMLALKWT